MLPMKKKKNKPTFSVEEMAEIIAGKASPDEIDKRKGYVEEAEEKMSGPEASDEEMETMDKKMSKDDDYEDEEYDEEGEDMEDDDEEDMMPPRKKKRKGRIFGTAISIAPLMARGAQKAKVE